jgi:uncharacterized phage protein (TIGR02218 family)
MPKVIPAALQAHYDTGQTALATALLIQRKDGALFGITSCSVPLVLDLTPWDTLPWALTGQTAFEFDARQGLDLKTIESTAGFEVDDSELQTLNDGTLFTEADILAGRWAEARFRLFLYRWDVAVPTIANDVEVLKVGSFGQTYPGRDIIRQELRCLKELLQHPVGIVSQPTCRARFGSQGSGQCNKDPAPFTFSLTVTAVASNLVFTASAATQAADYFGAGELTWTSGQNDGLSAQINQFSAGVFTLAAPMIGTVAIGDTFTAIAGCRKRRTQDCVAKFANGLNFQGEPDRPTTDRVVSGT